MLCYVSITFLPLKDYNKYNIYIYFKVLDFKFLIFFKILFIDLCIFNILIMYIPPMTDLYQELVTRIMILETYIKYDVMFLISKWYKCLNK